MAFNIFFTRQSVWLLFCDSLWVFFAHVFEFSLNDCTRGGLNFDPLCVSVDAGRTL